MTRSILKTLRLLRVVIGASACLPSVRVRTRAGSRPHFRGESNGRLYRSGGVDAFHVGFVALIIALSAFCVPVRAQTSGVMPTVTPVASVPAGPANGGGVVTRVTYELRPAANGVAGEAANAASYLTRPVTISGPTMGGIVRGVVKSGLRLAGWVGAAMLAYDAYKWFTDSNGQLTQPGYTTPGATCLSGGPFFQDQFFGQMGCSVPGAASRVRDWIVASHWNGAVSASVEGCVPPSVGTSCPYTLSYRLSDGRTFTQGSSILWRASGSTVTSDPDVEYPPAPVTDSQLGDLAQQYPEWWPDMLQDPLTHQPLITPEIASDMDALKQQIAPDYGVDPQTIPQTSPDPEYQQGTAEPRPQSMPPFCAWASRACEHFDFVEKNWPVVPPDMDNSQGPDDPADSAFTEDNSTGLENLDSSGFLGGGSCPGFPPVEYLGQNILSSDGICQTAGLLGAWLEGIAYALAALIGLRLKAGG